MAATPPDPLPPDDGAGLTTSDTVNWAGASVPK